MVVATVLVISWKSGGSVTADGEPAETVAIEPSTKGVAVLCSSVKAGVLSVTVPIPPDDSCCNVDEVEDNVVCTLSVAVDKISELEIIPAVVSNVVVDGSRVVVGGSLVVGASTSQYSPMYPAIHLQLWYATRLVVRGWDTHEPLFKHVSPTCSSQLGTMRTERERERDGSL